jgi:GTP-binding protein YchF
MDFAIVGLAQTGKSAFFDAVTAGHGQTTNRAVRVGVVKVSDERLEKLGALVRAKKITPLEVRFHDLPPVFEQGTSPSGESAEVLSQAEGLVHVVRAFHRDDMPHPEGSVDAHRDIAALDAEIILHDLGIVERRLKKLDAVVRSGRPAEREAGQKEQGLLRRVKKMLEESESPRGRSWDAQEVKNLANFGLLSMKPLLIIVNIDEADAAKAVEKESEFAVRYAAPGTAVAAMCAKLEAELAELPPEEEAEFRQELESGEAPERRVLRRTQELLGLVTFFTPVGDECRAWTVPAGATAVQAAGRIHTDMERGFIRAEAIAWDKLMELGSLAEAKKVGQLRTEGKQYVVREGDVLHILFH